MQGIFDRKNFGNNDVVFLHPLYNEELVAFRYGKCDSDVRIAESGRSGEVWGMGRTSDILDMFGQSPIVAAVKTDELLDKAVESECSVVFILYGNICTIGQLVKRVKDAGKTAIVHADLIGGLKDPVGVDYLKDHTETDGIISTRQVIVRRAKELGLIAGERTFIVDSMAFENCKAQLASGIRPDFLEVMPGLLDEIISELHTIKDVPLVAGGLIRSKQDILKALHHGACAISTTKSDLWAL